MELKEYQQEVIQDLRRFIKCWEQKKDLKSAFKFFWESQGVQMKSEDIVDGMQAYKPNLGAEIPHVCIKVPTAGGKTFLACNALGEIAEALPTTQANLVLWLVPSNTILEQTLKNLKDPEHPYRRRLNVLFNNRVAVYSKDQVLQGASFNVGSVREQLNILVMSFDSFRSRKKVDRLIYRENGALAPFIDVLNNTDFLLEDEKVDKYSLMNVIRSLRPICIIDESHRAESDLSVEMLQNMYPSFVLDLTATPRKNSNLISVISASRLKDEQMIKLPVIVYNHNKPQDVISSALDMRHNLEVTAREQADEYIRPIVLFQAEPKTKKDSETFQKIKAKLIAKGVPAEQIAIKTAYINELKSVDLMSRDCEIRYIITVNALKEGWDCPFAYILATIASKSSKTDVEQILGRVLRLPYTREQKNPLLNMAYVFTSSSNFTATLDNIVEGLNKAGFSDAKERSEIIVLDEQEEVVEGVQGTIDEEGLRGAISQLLEEGELDAIIESSEPIRSELQTADPAKKEKIKSALLDKLTEKALAVHQQDQHKRIAEREEDPFLSKQESRMKKMINTTSIKEDYRSYVEGIRLPQFFQEAPKKLEQLFSRGKEETGYLLFDKESLKEDFKLAKASVDINFNPSDKEIYEIDIQEGENSREGNVKYSRFSSDKASRFLDYLNSQSNRDKKLERTAEAIVSAMGKMPPYSDQDLKKYVLRVFEAGEFKDQEIYDLATNMQAIKIIKNHIDRCGTSFAQEEFYKRLASRKLVIRPSYQFTLTNTYTSNGESNLAKGLYTKEEDGNKFENGVIDRVAALDNVVFWHRIISRKGFFINGPINHYPDFLIYTKNKGIILVETKGAHLSATEDTKEKARLGSQWASHANALGDGFQYNYCMVFRENTAIDGSYTVTDLIALLAEL